MFKKLKETWCPLEKLSFFHYESLPEFVWSALWAIHRPLCPFGHITREHIKEIIDAWNERLRKLGITFELLE